MSLNPPRQPSGPAAHRSGQDAEALLLEAVRHRRGHESLVRLQRCVHRRGLDWLERFQTLTLPALEGTDAADWFAALLGEGSALMAADRQGVGEEQSWIEQRVTAAVDGAIASMLAEFPELVPNPQPWGFALPLTLAPPSLPVQEVLPERLPPPVFSFTGDGDLASILAAGLPLEILPGEFADESAKEGHSHPEPSGSAAFIDDHAPLEGSPADFAEPRRRSAAEIGAALRSSLLGRLSRTQWRSLGRIRTDRGAQDHGLDAGLLPQLPDPLAVVVRLAERQSDPNLQQDAAPAPTALADLRAWLPDSSLPRAS
ncbi:MAG: hypothetical protein NTW51_02300 [Cyanobacteria bacterium]|nr:hypothetical protein [Cyanobacteriota bacterium]